MIGKAYGVGVGPGDPELMTVKAIRMIEENRVIAFPGKTPEESVAYRIAKGMVPDIDKKELLPIHMPMIKDREKLDEAHNEATKVIEEYLDKGENVVFLTLGDPTVYCTFSYIQHKLEADGYAVELVSGVTSFCAAAARLGIPLSEWDEQIHIVPGLHNTDGLLEKDGTYVLMKSGKSMEAVKETIRKSGRNASAVINCGMESEEVYKDVNDIPDDAGYFSLIISK